MHSPLTSTAAPLKGFLLSSLFPPFFNPPLNVSDFLGGSDQHSAFRNSGNRIEPGHTGARDFGSSDCVVQWEVGNMVPRGGVQGLRKKGKGKAG